MIPVQGAVYRSIRQFERKVVPQVDGIVFVSHAARQDFLSWFPEADTVPSEVIPNFVKPISTRHQKEIGDLVTIGGLEIAKNHRFLLQVLDEARKMGSQLTLDLYGDGSCRKDLERLTSFLDLTKQVRFRGFRPDAREFLPAYRMYVHASYSEALPLAIIEAMAAGLPIVTTSAGGAPELCRHGIEGEFWSLDDPRRAANLLLDFIGDETRRSAAGVAALKRYESHFHAAVVGPQLYAFLTHSTALESSCSGFSRPPRDGPSIETEAATSPNLDPSDGSLPPAQ